MMKTEKESYGGVKGRQTLTPLAGKRDMPARQIAQWRTQLLDGAVAVFPAAAEKREEGDFLAVAPDSIGEASAKKGSIPPMLCRSAGKPNCSRSRARMGIPAASACCGGSGAEAANRPTASHPPLGGEPPLRDRLKREDFKIGRKQVGALMDGQDGNRRRPPLA